MCVIITIFKENFIVCSKLLHFFNYRSKAILYMGLQLYIQSFGEKKTICGST